MASGTARGVKIEHFAKDRMKEKKNCFVIMPFAEKYLEIYQEVYKPVCEANGLDCWRVDEISRPGSITRDIIEGIIDSDIILADLTSKNPNVFYELGIAHSVGNKTIMTAQSTSDIPFDIGNYRVIIYEQSIKGSKEFYSKLQAAIQDLMKALDQTNNPFQEVVAGKVKFGQKGKVPLSKYIDFSALNWQARNYLKGNEILFVEDLKKLDLERMANTDGIGKSSLSGFVSQLLSSDLYGDPDKIQNFILKYNLKTSRYR